MSRAGKTIAVLFVIIGILVLAFISARRTPDQPTITVAETPKLEPAGTFRNDTTGADSYNENELDVGEPTITPATELEEMVGVVLAKLSIEEARNPQDQALKKKQERFNGYLSILHGLVDDLADDASTDARNALRRAGIGPKERYEILSEYVEIFEDRSEGSSDVEI